MTLVVLSLRERETLGWVAEGKSYWVISRLMGISRHTVDKHMRSVREKFNVTSQMQAVVKAMRLHLL